MDIRRVTACILNPWKDIENMENEIREWIAYYRVSTQRQGESGLGLDAQRTVVKTFLSGRGGEVVAEFTETESGKKASNRPQLQVAMEVCRKQRATLVIAKLDRLARNVHFISGLMESGVDFVAVDQFTKDRFMLHVQAAFAEEEARRISMRTKEALAAAKRRGTNIGATGRALAARHKAEAIERARALAPVVALIRAQRFSARCRRRISRMQYSGSRPTLPHATC